MPISWRIPIGLHVAWRRYSNHWLCNLCEVIFFIFVIEGTSPTLSAVTPILKPSSDENDHVRSFRKIFCFHSCQTIGSKYDLELQWMTCTWSFPLTTDPTDFRAIVKLQRLDKRKKKILNLPKLKAWFLIFPFLSFSLRVQPTYIHTHFSVSSIAILVITCSTIKEQDKRKRDSNTSS